MQVVNDADIFAAVGGERVFVELVDRFYAGVETDPPLRSLYPDDLTLGKQHLAWFLMQRFGGPDHFNSRRGAPRLRLRHNPFAITPDQAQRWLKHMTFAVDSMAEFAPYRKEMLDYFVSSALFLVNKEPLPDGSIDISHIPIRNGKVVS